MTGFDYETQSQYSFAVIATDGVNSPVQQSVTLYINDLDDAAPTITSGSVADAIDENSGAGQVVYTATADDSGDDVVDGPMTFSLAEGSDTALSIVAETGEVTLTTNPDHEAQSQYSFAVVATDGAGNAAQQSVTLDINNLDDTAPTITSGDTAVAIGENSGANQVIYTAVADDSADVSASPITFSLTDGSDAALEINTDTGEVTLTTNPDHEAQSQYSFAVVATDAAGNVGDAHSVTLHINNLDEVLRPVPSLLPSTRTLEPIKSFTPQLRTTRRIFLLASHFRWPKARTQRSASMLTCGR